MTMDLDDPQTRDALRGFLARVAHARDVNITAAGLLAGGAANDTYILNVRFSNGLGRNIHRLVLRTGRAVGVAGSLSRAEEFAVMQAAFQVGVLLPEPLWCAAAGEVLDHDFIIMRHVHGTTDESAIVHDARLGGPHDQLAEQLGAQLARLQTITPASEVLPFLPRPTGPPGAQLVAALYAVLDSLEDSHPVIEWGLRWLNRNTPAGEEWVLSHGDFRTGNYLVDRRGLRAILDWGLASWSDPLADLAWFCLSFWRLDQEAKTAGGIASRQALLRGYQNASGREIAAADFRFWEILANVRCALNSVQQALRRPSGRTKSLQLCLTGRRTAELEFEILRLVAAADREVHGQCAIVRK